jgi:hypothetical protein
MWLCKDVPLTRDFSEAGKRLKATLPLKKSTFNYIINTLPIISFHPFIE